MPEGHIAHFKVLEQTPHLVGVPVGVSSPNRRFETGAAALDSATVRSLQAHGKHLFYNFDARRVLHVHLGMNGSFDYHRGGSSGAAKRSGRSRSGAWLQVSSPSLTFDLRSPKVCELVDAAARDRITAALGPDPILVDEAPRGLGAILEMALPVGAVIVDQSVIAGIGNVYRAEILYACAIHPDRQASTLSDDDLGNMWACAVRMLRAGVADGGRIRTVDRRRDLKVRDSRTCYVYGQRFCARCGGLIRRWMLAGQFAYACEACQPLAV